MSKFLFILFKGEEEIFDKIRQVDYIYALITSVEMYVESLFMCCFAADCMEIKKI